MRGSSWDAVLSFCFQQATLTTPEAHAVRGVAARAALWLGVLRAARCGWLQPGWRGELPTFADTGNIALTTAAMDLANEPVHAWEPAGSGAAGLAAAANAWYQSVTVMLFDVIFMQADAITEGRSPDDEWHRRELPAALQRAVHVTQIGFHTATLDPVARDHFVAQLDRSSWVDDQPFFGPPPREWHIPRPQPVVKSGVRPKFHEALRGYLGE